jgi:hypothetical protein
MYLATTKKVRRRGKKGKASLITRYNLRNGGIIYNKLALCGDIRVQQLGLSLDGDFRSYRNFYIDKFIKLSAFKEEYYKKFSQ